MLLRTTRATSPMAKQRQSQDDRFAQLQRILSALLAEQRFTLQGLRQTFPGESRRIVTQLVRDLESEGYLREVDDEAFSWVCEAADFPARSWLEKKVYTTQLL